MSDRIVFTLDERLRVSPQRIFLVFHGKTNSIAPAVQGGAGGDERQQRSKLPGGTGKFRGAVFRIEIGHHHGSDGGQNAHDQNHFQERDGTA